MSADETDLGTPPSAPRAQLPERINHYRIEGKLGAGGMGEVYGAYDERLHRDVALKVLRGGREHDGEARARFWREARVLAALNHPSIVRVYEFGETEGGELFLAMAFIPGKPLVRGADSVESLSDALSAIRDVADGLAEAHKNGVVHRDIKPSNVIVGEDGAVVLIDFGIARARHDGMDTMTSTGAALGSPAYMSPEQLRGEEVTPAADVYGCGVVLFELLTGRRPFVASSAFATAIAVEAGDRPALRDLRDDLPDDVVALVEDCLALRAEDRPQDGAALRDRLDAVIETGIDGTLPEREAPVRVGAHIARPRAKRSPWPRVALALGFVLACAGLAGWWFRAQTPAPVPAVPVWDARPARPVIALEADADESLAGVSELVAETARVALDSTPTRWVSWPEPPTEALIALAARNATTGQTVGASPEPASEATSATTGDTASDIDSAAGGGATDQPSRGAPASAEAGRVRLDAVLYVQARLVPNERALELSLSAETPSGERIDAWSLRTPSQSPVEAGLLLADSIAQWLGQPAAGGPPATQSAEALSLYLSVRDAEIDFDDTARENINTALAYDPHFGAAAVEQASIFRTDRLLTRIPPFVDRVLAEPVPPRQEQLLAGLRAIGVGDTHAAYLAFSNIVDERLYDRRALYLLLALPHHDASLLRRDDQARLARQLLQVMPGDEIAASRLIRVFPWNDRAEIERELESLGVFEALGDGRREVDAEIALLAGDYQEAIDAYGAAVAESPGAVYPTHQRAAAMILDGQCEAATTSLFSWISDAEAASDGGNLSWSYSLAFQALLCQREYEAAERTLERFHARHPDWPEYKQQSLFLMLARGAPPEVVSTLAMEILEGSEWGTDELTVLHVLSITSQTPAQLRSFARRARALSLDLASSRELQLGFARAARSLESFAALYEEADCQTSVLPGLQQNVGSTSDDLTEGDMYRRTDARVELALASERCGLDSAASLWREVLGLGYPRLYRTASAQLAERQLASLSAAESARAAGATDASAAEGASETSEAP